MNSAKLYYDAKTEGVTAIALRDSADYELDSIVASFKLRLLEAVGNNRNAPLYRQIFTNGLAGITRVSIAKELEEIKDLTKKADENPEFPEELKSYVSKMAKAGETLNEKNEKYKETLRKKSSASINLELAKEDWIRQYRSNYGIILSLYPGNRKKNEMFFKKLNVHTENSPLPEE